MNQGRVYPCKQVARGEAGQTLLQLLTRRYSHTTEPTWKGHILADHVELNDEVCSEPARVLKAGDKVVFHRPAWREPDVPDELPVLFEDEHLLVVNKPSGLPTMPSEIYYENTLARKLLRMYPKQQVVPTHRLGVGTSGALVCAKTLVAKRHMAKCFRERSGGMCKRYRALIPTRHAITGQPIGTEAIEITSPIGQSPYIGRMKAINIATPEGKASRSILRVLERGEDTSIAEVEIPTGRPHQIRIHTAFVGHPLIGDPLYVAGGVTRVHVARAANKDSDGEVKEEEGEDTPLPRDLGYTLHSHTIEFDHPQTGKHLTIIAPPPPALQLSSEQAKPNPSKAAPQPTTHTK